MKVIKELNKRISKDTISIPFAMSKDEDRVIIFDKVLTGNGGSTAFLQLPIKEGFVNLMIAPNVAVVEDKQNQYNEKPELYGDKDIRFIYGGALDNNVGISIEGRFPDTIVMVADSFFIFKERLQKFNVDKILIDEAHSIVQQSAFRKSLVNFSDRVKGLFPLSEIVMMTATPTLFMDVDVRLEPSHVKGFDIHYTRDREGTIANMISDVKNGFEVVCFSNNRQIISKLKCGKKYIDANLITGDSLNSGIVKEQEVRHNPDSNLTISSSKGFEGFDIWYNNANVYYFEDRANVYESHYPSNLIQASGRTRNGANKITYCRLGVSKAKKDVFKKDGIDIEVNNFVSDERRSAESKLSKTIVSKPNNPASSKIKNIYVDYIQLEQTDEGIVEVRTKKDSIDLYKESRVCDKEFPQKEYETLYKDRGIKFIDDDSTHNRNQMKNIKGLDRIKKNLFSNIDYIESKGMYGEEHRISWRANLHKIYKSGTALESLKSKVRFDYEVYLAELNYNGQYDFKEHQLKISELLDYEMVDGNVEANGTFEALREELIQLKKDKLNDKGFEYEEQEVKLDEFKTNSVIYLSRILYMFAGHRAYVPNNITLNRNYNFATTIPLRMIEHVANYLNIEVTEIDIVSCNPRILYAKCGLNLPKNFYGENKENKKTISTLLNNFMYNELKNTSYKLQKSQAKKNLSKYLDEKVVSYLMDNYFEVKRNYRGQFTSDCAFHEKNIIKELKKTIAEELNEGCIERHDSIILFNNRQSLDHLQYFYYSRYKDIRGWFVDYENVDAILDENESKLDSGDMSESVEVAS